jgi:hypothetical protein
VLRALSTPGTIRSEVFRAKDLAAECNRRTCLWARDLVAYQEGCAILGVGAMSSAFVSLEFDVLAAKEVDKLNKAIDAYARDGCLPHECVFTELTRRMTIIRNVSQCTHVYNGWKNLSTLMETWMDRDLWEAAARTEILEKASPSPSTSGCTNTA